MNSVIGLWSLKVSPSAEGVEFEAETDIKITNVALGDDEETPNKTGRSTVKLVYQNPSWDNEEQGPAHEPEIVTTICSLTCGKVEQISTDIVIPQDGIYKFIVTGQNTVYITGQRIHQASMGDLDSDSESSIDSEEEAYRLQDVSSDVEIDAADLDSDADRFEEIDSDTEAGKPKQLKRPRESMDVDGADAPAKLSKADKKKQKKQKGEDGKAVEDKVAPTPEKKDKKEKASKGETKELPSGLRITDSKVGTGPQAKKGQRIEMRYIGKLQNGKIFDQNTKGKPFAFRLGNGEVIKGWDEGIAGMQVGGERLLVIPPGLAYGKKGSPPQIPGNSTLTFECKLISVK